MRESRSSASKRKEQSSSAQKDQGGKSLSSPKTPRRKQADPLIGLDFVCPGHIFHTPDQSYPGVITGVRKPGEELWVKFEDGTHYWFDRSDLLEWAVDPPRGERQVMQCALALLSGNLGRVNNVGLSCKQGLDTGK